MFKFFQCWDPVYTSEFDVYRRQILTYKDGPRAERVKSHLKHITSDIGDIRALGVNPLSATLLKLTFTYF